MILFPPDFKDILLSIPPDAGRSEPGRKRRDLFIVGSWTRSAAEPPSPPAALILWPTHKPPSPWRRGLPHSAHTNTHTHTPAHGLFTPLWSFIHHPSQVLHVKRLILQCKKGFQPIKWQHLSRQSTFNSSMFHAWRAALERCFWGRGLICKNLTLFSDFGEPGFWSELVLLVSVLKLASATSEGFFMETPVNMTRKNGNISETRVNMFSTAA